MEYIYYIYSFFNMDIIIIMDFNSIIILMDFININIIIIEMDFIIKQIIDVIKKNINFIYFMKIIIIVIIVVNYMLN